MRFLAVDTVQATLRILLRGDYRQMDRFIYRQYYPVVGSSGFSVFRRLLAVAPVRTAGLSSVRLAVAAANLRAALWGLGSLCGDSPSLRSRIRFSGSLGVVGSL